jgi:hypothetical protein
MADRTILCMKWGHKYGPEYVNKLFNMVNRHLTLDFKMVCLTDDSNGINKQVECFPIPSLNLPYEIPERGWNKLSTFESDLYGLQGEALFLDLDVVILDNIDELFSIPGDFFIIHDWKRPWRISGNSSVYRFTLGEHPGLLTYFVEHFDEVRDNFRNEQAFLSWYINKNSKLQYWPSEWCKSFKYHCLKPLPLSFFIPPKPPKGAKIIVFHGEINPPDAIQGTGGKWYRHVLPSPWISDQWQ